MNVYRTLRRDENQARGLAQYAIDFLADDSDQIAPEAIRRVVQFHADSVACAVSALALGANAPSVLRREAMEYPTGSAAGPTCFGSRRRVAAEKAVAANCSAVREWDANGTNFGYNPALGRTAGEFGHNDFYPVVVAAAALHRCDGRRAVRAMLLIDEIRGRLAESFALRRYKIDHVVHGAVASAVVYGAMAGATVDQIESAVGLVVAHYVPFRAIRAGKQLSDSKGASAALSAEAAVLSMRRAISGFVGPADVFRNPEAIFCLNEPPERPGESPFDLTLAESGDDFAVTGMHFKLGLYEHQSAGAIEGLIGLVSKHPELLDDETEIAAVRIAIYQPAFGIIGDPAKRDPQSRQSADHSMPYIVATLLRKALEQKRAGWKELMLLPDDYDAAALANPTTRRLMQKIDFYHGGAEFDAKYPDGIPTTVEIEHRRHGSFSSGLVMYPLGHARDASGRLDAMLAAKFDALARLGVDDPAALVHSMDRIESLSADEMARLYSFPILNVAD
jgi:2-methylcitrate dehydratase